MKDSKNIPIVFLHGLGATPITMWPLKEYIKRWGGYKNTYLIKYEVDHIKFEEALEKLDKQLEEILDKKLETPVFVGQSMGGLMANNLHKKGWNPLKTITIGSPLHGARFLNQLESVLPNFIVRRLKKRSYEYLMDKPKDEKPPHEHHTITMSWFFTNFDGCVYKDEAMYDEENNTHLYWADHRTIFGNPRLWIHVLNKIKNI